MVASSSEFVATQGELQASKHDKFAVPLYRSRREYRAACERAGKGGKRIEHCTDVEDYQLPRALR